MRLQFQYTKSAITSIYVTKLKGYDNDLFASQIIERGDEQDRKTNVQADMTKWVMKEWQPLCKEIVEDHLIYLSGEINVTWLLDSIWGVNYKEGDYTRFHAHRPSTFSFCYYAKAGENAAPLVFSDVDYELKPEESQLIIFPSHLNHGVPSQIDNSGRVVISGNVTAQINKE